MCVSLSVCVSLFYSQCPYCLSHGTPPSHPHTPSSLYLWPAGLYWSACESLNVWEEDTERERECVCEKGRVESGICVPICAFQFTSVCFVCECDCWSNKNRTYLAPRSFEVRTLELAFIRLIGDSLILLLWVLKIVLAVAVCCSFFFLQKPWTKTYSQAVSCS